MKALLAVLLIVVAVPAWAQNWPRGVSDKVTTGIAGPTSGHCLAANDRKTLTFDNIAGGVDIAYCETDATAPATPCTAAIDTPPSTNVVVGALHYFVPGPVGQFCFIARSGTQNFTIREGQ